MNSSDPLPGCWLFSWERKCWLRLVWVASLPSGEWVEGSQKHARKASRTGFLRRQWLLQVQFLIRIKNKIGEIYSWDDFWKIKSRHMWHRESQPGQQAHSPHLPGPQLQRRPGLSDFWVFQLKILWFCECHINHKKTGYNSNCWLTARVRERAREDGPNSTLKLLTCPWWDITAELRKLVPVRLLVWVHALPGQAFSLNKSLAGTLAFSSRIAKPIMNVIWRPGLRSCLTAACPAGYMSYWDSQILIFAREYRSIQILGHALSTTHTTRHQPLFHRYDTICNKDLQNSQT